VDISKSPRVRTTDALWRDAFETADAVSEGAPREEARGHVWYGSTSLILHLSGEGATTEAERAFVAAVAARDLHVRTRALRLAVREAAVRAGQASPGHALGRSKCEIRFAVDPEGVRIDVDVEAMLVRQSGKAARRAR
jgi:hypothetical protein